MLAVIMPIAFNVETGAIPRSAEVYVKRTGQGPPWWSSGWDSTCRCRGHGFDPWSGKIPFAVRERSLCAPTREATTTEARAPQWESCSRAPQLEKSPGTETKTQLSHKWSTNNFKRRAGQESMLKTRGTESTILLWGGLCHQDPASPLFEGTVEVWRCSVCSVTVEGGSL